MPDSEDEDDHCSMEEACLVTGFLRNYIENGQLVYVFSDLNNILLLELLVIIEHHIY